MFILHAEIVMAEEKTDLPTEGEINSYNTPEPASAIKFFPKKSLDRSLRKADLKLA